KTTVYFAFPSSIKNNREKVAHVCLHAHEQPYLLFDRSEGANVEQINDERIDYIAGTDYKVVQSPNVFSYSIDAVLLARFVHVPMKRGLFLDLCTGNGIIPLILTTRSKGK